MNSKRDCRFCSPVAVGCRVSTMGTWKRRQKLGRQKCRVCSANDKKAREEGTRK